MRKARHIWKLTYNSHTAITDGLSGSKPVPDFLCNRI